MAKYWGTNRKQKNLYTVKAGDTWLNMAEKLKSGASALAKANMGISQLRAGQVIKVPKQLSAPISGVTKGMPFQPPQPPKYYNEPIPRPIVDRYWYQPQQRIPSTTTTSLAAPYKPMPSGTMATPLQYTGYQVPTVQPQEGNMSDYYQRQVAMNTWMPPMIDETFNKLLTEGNFGAMDALNFDQWNKLPTAQKSNFQYYQGYYYNTTPSNPITTTPMHGTEYDITRQYAPSPQYYNAGRYQGDLSAYDRYILSTKEGQTGYGQFQSTTPAAGSTYVTPTSTAQTISPSQWAQAVESDYWAYMQNIELGLPTSTILGGSDPWSENKQRMLNYLKRTKQDKRYQRAYNALNQTNELPPPVYGTGGYDYPVWNGLITWRY